MPATDEKFSKGKDSFVENFNPNEKSEDNLWVSILGEVLASSQTKVPVSKSLLVLGDNESGKTTLIAKGQGVSEPRKGAALEFLYINVKDEYGEDQTRLGAWVLDGDLHHRGLLKFALTEQNFEHTVVLLVASLSKPWDIMDHLQKWSEVLSTHVQRLKLAPSYRKERQDSVYRHFQEYQEPEEGATAGQTRRGQSVGDISEMTLLPLGDNILTENLGIPVVVVLTKSDAMTDLEKNNDYQLEHWDFIQQHVRKFCLKYGAALFYTSVKENKNCSLLFKYLTHIIYGFPFAEQACVVEKDAVFIPAGWDNEKKVSVLYEGLTSMRHTDRFTDIIRAPLVRNTVQREVEIIADEEQLFLMKLQTQLTKQPVDTTAQRVSSTPTGGHPANKVSPSRSTSSSAASPGNMPAKKPGAQITSATSDTGVLANFFNSLLSKKTATDRQVSSDATQNSSSPSEGGS